MGVDKSLGESFPNVTIAGEVYQYGRVPACAYEVDGKKPPFPEEWVVEHWAEPKDSWCFPTEAAMVDFLENLPESAVYPTVRGVPLWMLKGLEPDLNRVWKAHKRRLARLLREKRKKGTTYRYRG